jgi:5-methylcytosine-specific restriction endonuclease McrA
MPNKYFCSDGERVSEATIRRRLSEAYRAKYEGNPQSSCFECSRPAECSSHIIPKSVCKQLRKTELIWDWENFVPTCLRCNTLLENVSSPEFKKLNGYEYYVEIFRKYDRERWMKSI